MKEEDLDKDTLIIQKMIENRRQFLPTSIPQVYADRELMKSIFVRRIDLLIAMIKEYSRNPIAFIEDWVMTLDPRKDVSKMPFVLYDFQKIMVNYLEYLMQHNVCGLIEKSRDMGATWVCCAFSVWLWLFKEGKNILWTSKKLQMLDASADPGSVFYKIKFIINELPDFLVPINFNHKLHLNFLRIYNPHMDNAITGAMGEDAGRSSRACIFFRDESAHYENPQAMEAGASAVSDVRVDLSSVYGTGTPFHDKRKAAVMFDPDKVPNPGDIILLVLKWQDHPEKDEKWYYGKLREHMKQNKMFIFKQEYERDYNASVKGILIQPEWLDACRDAHTMFEGTTEEDWLGDGWYGGYDSAFTGGDKNAFVARCGSIVLSLKEWGKAEADESAARVLEYCRNKKDIILSYDANGLGASVGREWINMEKNGDLRPDIKIVSYISQNAAYGADLDMEEGGRTNREFFENLKAQGWWNLRERIYTTFLILKRRNFKKGKLPEGVTIKNLISFPSDLEGLEKLIMELSQVVGGTSQKGRFMIMKQPEGTKSPNLGDACMFCFHEDNYGSIHIGRESDLIIRGY